ncbi:MAG: hypothetical protein WBA38_15945 [Gordonia sp. (in: high G+C Gram-positive bacteria)]|uniref:hypothetical protein n=1 Tax=Gordonia sp. (in: high G+C Gram-positive bacteria) TaxID=84139 RepID=UPI003C77F91C
MTSNDTDRTALAPPRHRVRKWALRFVVGFVATVGLLGAVPIAVAVADVKAGDPPVHPAFQTERAIVALVSDHPLDALAYLPAKFVERFGYTPEVVDARPLNPHGDCSSPISLPDAFTNACRAHDFGYDLLRDADSEGRPIGAWARQALDRKLFDDMHNSCRLSPTPGCTAAAETARVAVSLNTWRQRSGPPRPETTGDIAVTYLTRAVEALGLS